MVIRYTVLDLNPTVDSPVRVHYGFRPIAAAIVGESPVTIGSGDTFAALDVPPATLASSVVSDSDGIHILAEDAAGNGAMVAAQGSQPAMTLGFDSGSPASLQQPLRLLYNVFPITEGKTVPAEVLGSGDATLAGQTFSLRHSPLTYYRGSPPQSTLRIAVDGIPWNEALTFYGQPADAKIFVTRRDPSQKTTVYFGDGVHGARLPTGKGNVVATYRYGNAAGQGAPSPPATTLVTVVSPQPGLSSIRNPLGVKPGDPPTPAAMIQKQGPASVQTFRYAVSRRDFDTLAKSAGAAWTRTVTVWNSQIRRSQVVVYIDAAEGTSTFAAVAAAFAGASDPNRPIQLRAATVVPLKVVVALIVVPGWDPETIRAEVVAALETGPLSPDHLYIDYPPLEDLIVSACFEVEGVEAALARVELPRKGWDEGTVFTFPSGNLIVRIKVEGHD
jgi:hypothetical protein